MQKAAYVYLLTLLAFLALDAVWLGIVAKNFYKKFLGHLMAVDINWTAALLFYLVYIAAILVFVTAPAVKSGSLARAVMLGAFLGLVCYATYDLNNLATLRDWPLVVTVVDLIWGAIITAATATASFFIARWVGWRPE
jgi:uncharacterized membrane protein